MDREGSYDEEEEEEKLRQQEVLLRRTVEENEEYEILDWEKEIAKHRASIQQSERETEERQERATKKRESWELLKLCREFLRDNGKEWHSASSQREEEKKNKRTKDQEKAESRK